MVARHYGPNYVLPATGLSGLTVALAIHLGPHVVERRRLALAVMVPLAVFLVAREAVMGLARYRNFERNVAERLAVAAAAHAVPAATLVYYYRASAQVFALRFGDEYSAGRWTAWLAAHYPGAVFYSPFSGRFASYGQPGALPWASEGRLLLFQGTTLGAEEYTLALAGHGLVPILAGPDESVYRAPALW